MNWNNFALPRSHALGRSSGVSPWCNSRNLSHRSASVGTASRYRRCSVPSRPITNVAMGDTVRYELDGHVATITYNRPEVMNAINGELRRDLTDPFARFRDAEDGGGAMVRGAGRAFCVGADLKDGGRSVGEFAGTFWEKPTTNSFES